MDMPKSLCAGGGGTSPGWVSSRLSVSSLRKWQAKAGPGGPCQKTSTSSAVLTIKGKTGKTTRGRKRTDGHVSHIKCKVT